MNGILGGNQQPQTWAQSIQAYQRGKTTLPWNPADVPPPIYVKQFEVSRKSREVDPVLMRHRDPDVESKWRQREETRVRGALNNAKNRQLLVEQNYDLINHRPHLTGTGSRQGPVQPPRHPDTKTAYNILNHVPRECSHSLSLLYPEGESPDVLPQKVVTVEGGKKPFSHLRRDVDVLSNRFLEQHEEKVLEEQQFLREQAQEKYQQTHDYNLITGKYYDEGKEKKFVHTRGELEALQGRAQRHRLPPSIRYGEGNEYDIISKMIKNPPKKGSTDSVADRGLIKRARGREAHEENVRQHNLTVVASEERALNRPSHQRHAERLRTGHDIISNQIFTGREGRPPPSPRARAPVPVWNRLSVSRTRNRREEMAKPSSITGERGSRDSTGINKNESGSRTGGKSAERERDSLGRGEQEASNMLVKKGDRRRESSGASKEERGDGESTLTTAATKQIVPPLDLSRRLSDAGGV